MHKKLTILAMLIVCAALCGCVKREATDSGVIVSYEMWVGFAGVLGGIAATAFGWYLKSHSVRGWIFLIMAFLGTVTFSPFGFVDHVTVTHDRLQARWGFWCFPSTYDIAFADVSSVSLSKKITSGRRGRKNVSYNLDFSKRDGSVVSMTATNSLMEEASEDIVAELDSHNIPFNDVTGE
ncbi:MAG TPA: hypothetical protein PLR25_17725 [Planctomycetaceae bacterium]|nr:hypothetical protein [Planctomycetaceae bacterium]